MWWRRLSELFPKTKRMLEVNLGELEDEGESLSSFLRSKLDVNVTSEGNKVLVESENLASNELKRLVNKFIYRRNLMNS